MKTNYTLCALALGVLLTVSCTRQARIEGTTTLDELEGKHVSLLIQSQDTEKQIITAIKRGRFAFIESVDEPYLTTLSIEGLDPMPIYVERGKTQVEVTAEHITYNGTPNNTPLSTFLQIQEEEEDFIAHAFPLALDNANLPVGKDIFLDIYYLLDVEQLGLFLSRLSDEEKANGKGKIPRIATMYDALLSTSVGKLYTNYTQCTPAGDTLSISNLVGKKDYLLLDFWASWCGPCRRAMPQMKELYQQYNDRLDILGISLDNNHEDWVNAIKTLDLPWQQMSDLGGWSNAAAERYGVMFIPTTVLISRDGTIIGRNLSEEELMQRINP